MDLVAQDHRPTNIQTIATGSLPYEYLAQSEVKDEIGVLTRLRRHKLLFSSTFIGVLAIVGAAYFALDPVYKAEALITIAPPDQVLASEKIADGQQLTVGDSADLESQSIVLASPTILRGAFLQPSIQSALLEECSFSQPSVWQQQLHRWMGAKPRPACSKQIADADTMVESLRKRVLVSVSGRSRVLTLAFSSPIPDVAKIVTNAIVQTYLDAQKQEKLRPRDEAIAWLRSQMLSVEDRLKLNETAIQSSLQANGVVRGETAPVASEQLTGLAQQIATAEAERAAAAGRMIQAETNGSATTGVLENRTVNEDKQQLATINSQIAQLSARYGSAYPQLADLQQQRRALERALLQDTNVVNRSATTDFQSANTRVSALQKEMDSLKQEVKSNDNATTQVASLERALATDRELYLDLSKNLSQLETNRRLATPNAHLISLAELPMAVSFPKASSFALTGVILATAVASIVTLLLDRCDRSVRSATNLQAAADLRVLARIPHVSGIGRGAFKIGARIAAPSAFQEAVRRLYAECLLISGRLTGVNQRTRTILVTSSDRHEGKTFTALALAHFAASAGRRVLVLECDLRQPSIARNLSLLPTWGVSEILKGQILPEEAVLSSEIPGLNIIPSGNSVSDSAELLSGSRWKQLLAWATARYDLVIIDSPPSQILPDARILAPTVDGVLYCTRWGTSDTEFVVQGVREIQEVGGNLLGLVVNDFQPSRYNLYEKASRVHSQYLAST